MNTYFSLNDEQRIWNKLNPDLKRRKRMGDVGILQDTNIRVIKKCLFFLINFSRNLQDSIALKLIKRVFQPNERLGSGASSQNIYIVDQGRAELQLVKHRFNKPIFKTLRVINRESLKDKFSVSSNLFGFTATILRRRVNLTAISREFIVTYELEHKDFEDLLAQEPNDFETVC